MKKLKPARLLCLAGLHKWRPVYWSRRWLADHKGRICERCGRLSR